MANVIINQDACKGCGLCARACPKKIMVISKTKINSKGYHPAEVIELSACTACASCARSCPDVCIEIEK